MGGLISSSGSIKTAGDKTLPDSILFIDGQGFSVGWKSLDI